MARRQPTFFLLDERTGRRTGKAEGVAVDRGAGLILTTDPEGALALDSADGSLGGLRLPRGMAIDDSGLVYLLVGDRIKRFDPQTGRFARLEKVGGPGSEPRLFDRPRDVTVAGDNLYVADAGNGRIQVFDLPTMALVHVFEANGGPAWRPWSLASADGAGYWLDRSTGSVWRHHPGSNDPVLIIDRPEGVSAPKALAVDRDGLIYLLDQTAAGPVLRVFDSEGEFTETISDSGQIRSRFQPPAIRADHRGRFCLPDSLTHLCDRRLPEVPALPNDPLAACRGPNPTGLLFDSKGRPIQLNPEEPPGPAVYRQSGRWWSEPLDSKIHRCQWHRIEMTLPALPPGARVTISTLTSDTELGQVDLETASDSRWQTRSSFVGALQPPPGKGPRPEPIETDLLIQSRHGRYLWLRIDLEGDGFSSPSVDAIRVIFPRATAIDFLPALYSAEEESRWFLERFLSILQTEQDGIDRQIADVRRLFDPEAVPDDFVDYLAEWLNLPLEGAWNPEQKRRMLAAAPEFYPKRGTPEALRRVLQVYLWNLTEIEPDRQGEIPAVTEGFRERRRLLLAAEGSSQLGQPGVGAPLWSRSFVGRLQLSAGGGGFGREGEVRIVSTGDPERDLFHEFAHRFRVFVPSGWVGSDEDEAMLRRAIDAEKPAHTQYDLCLVEARLQVGVQSTVGLDSILGDYTELRLGCNEDTARRTSDHRLGIDSVLGSTSESPSRLSIQPATNHPHRIGIETFLT